MPDDVTDEQRRLNAARARKRRQALGPPLDQTDADLDAIAQAGPSDLGSVESFIRDAAGQAGVDLFRARRED